MRQYAVIDGKALPGTPHEGPRVWVLSVHSARHLAELRLREYLGAIFEQGRLAALAGYLPPGTVTTAIGGRLEVVELRGAARSGAWYYGKVYRRKPRMTSLRRRNVA